MPTKSKFKIKKGSKQPVGNISLHFKDLCDAESDSDDFEAQRYEPQKFDITSEKGIVLTEANEVDFNFNEMENPVPTSLSQAGIDPLMAVPTKLETIKSSPKSKPILPHSNDPNDTKFEVTAPAASLFGDDLLKPNNTSSSPIHKRDETSVTQNKIPTMQSVEDHPLALQLINEDEDEDSDSHEQLEPKSDHFSTEKGAVTKEMISSALFDSKARTQLFSTIKKNIQQYKNSSTVKTTDADQKLSITPPKNISSSSDGINHGSINSSDVSSTATRIRSVSQSSDILSQFGLNPESPLMKGLNRKVVEPLQAMKKAWEDSPKENALTTDSEVRKRSSSDFAVLTGTPYVHSRKSLSSNSDDLISSSKSVTEPTRSPSIAMSLSSLLAERQQNLHEENIFKSNSDKKDFCLKQKSEEENKNINEGVQLGSKFLIDKHKIVRSVPTSSIYLLYFSFIFIYFYFVLPLPLSVHIALSSFFIGFACSTIIIYLFNPSKTQPVVIKPPYISQTVPHQIPKSVFNPKKPFKGWMNEIDIYDLDTYHVSATQSVFVTLEGKTLRLQTPRRNIPKRAVFGERNIQVSNVIHQRILDVTKAKVYLVPDGLVKKRVWSKKYPICIEFSPAFGTKLGLEEKLKSPKKQHSDDTYDVISDDDLSEKIFLFGRTQRQKEEWFYRFQRAITISQKNADKLQPSPESIYPQEDDLNFGTEHPEGKDSKKESKEMKPIDKLSGLSDPIFMYQDYFTSMCRLLPDPAVYTTVKSGSSVQELSKDTVNIDQSRAVHFSMAASQSDGMPEVVMSQPRQIVRPPSQGEPGLEVAWFNVVVGRIMFDFLRLPKWADWLSNKIQKKLEKIKLPYFMDGLKLTELDLGTTVPLVHKISLPRLDSQGIWLDMDITYNGAVQMTLETKMVLTKLGKQNIVMSVSKHKLGNKSAITHSEEEDSAESSDDDESILTSPLPSSLQHLIPSGSENLPPFRARDKTHSNKNANSASSTPQQEKRWVRIVDSITKSKYFQKATENSYIKKKLESVSNTPLILMAELHQCRGTLSVNIPPPPSDRIWYGFKDHPHMVLHAHPKLGERAVTVTSITDWIEKKLIQEFNKVLLIPNMDDIPMPVMFNNLPTTPKQ